MGCAGGRWDRDEAQKLIDAGYAEGITAAAIRVAIAEIDRLDALRGADAVEAAANHAAAIAEIEALRCGDLGWYFDGQLSTERRDAFDRHLATCTTCADGLLGLMHEAANTDEAQHG